MRMRHLIPAAVFALMSAACDPVGGEIPPSHQAAALRRGCPDDVALSVQRAEGGAFHLSWTGARPGATFTLSAGESPEAGAIIPLGVVHDVLAADVAAPDPGARWYFRLHGPGARQVVGAERRFLDGAANFRDIGGYPTGDPCKPVRWGTAFRADALHGLTDGDRALLTRMGVRQVIDFRSNEEFARFPDRLPAGVDSLHLPIRLPIDPRLVLSGQVVADEAFVTGVFSQVVDANPDVYAALFRALAERDRLPLVYHCTGGEARTGIATALLFELLGVPEDTIAADFVLSHQFTGDIVRRQEEQIRALGGDPAKLATVLRPPASVIRGVLAHVRARYGSVEAYLATGGADAATVEAVRRNLLR